LKFYFNNPTSLIIYKAINSAFDNLDLEAIYVNPNPHKRNYDKIYSITSANSNFRISEHICRSLNISLSRIEWEQFIKQKSVLTESLLININNLNSNSVMLYAGDSYCIFGFISHKKFFRTKIMLKKYWNRKIMPQNQNMLYIFNKNNSKIKYSNVTYIDINISKYYLEAAANDLLPILFEECGLILSGSYLLVLPYPNFENSSYAKSFNSRVLEVAERENLNILIKPHKKDKVDYSEIFGDKMINSVDINLLKLIPVEFFFCVPNIKKIIASPSTSLVFAENTKLEILAPTNSNLYRKFFLDLETYLSFIGKKYTRI
jgi:hypothetical protein